MPAKGWSKKKNDRGNLKSVMKRLYWADPKKKADTVAKIKAGKERTGNTGNRVSVPNGMTREEAEVLWDKARAQAKRFIGIMEDAGQIEKTPIPGSEEEMGKKALEEAYVHAISPMTDKSTKATYLRMVLEWTKAKPESKSKLTLDKSEEWLNELQADLEKRDGGR